MNFKVWVIYFFSKIFNASLEFLIFLPLKSFNSLIILSDATLYLSPITLDVLSPISEIISDAVLIASFICNFIISSLALL